MLRWKSLWGLVAELMLSCCPWSLLPFSPARKNLGCVLEASSSCAASPKESVQVSGLLGELWLLWWCLVARGSVTIWVQLGAGRGGSRAVVIQPCPALCPLSNARARWLINTAWAVIPLPPAPASSWAALAWRTAQETIFLLNAGAEEGSLGSFLLSGGFYLISGVLHPAWTPVSTGSLSLQTEWI